MDDRDNPSDLVVVGPGHFLYARRFHSHSIGLGHHRDPDSGHPGSQAGLGWFSDFAPVLPVHFQVAADGSRSPSTALLGWAGVFLRSRGSISPVSSSW